MLSGLIVYSEIDRDKNTWFIETCKERLFSHGVVLFYRDEDKALNFVKENHVDFVIYRARNYKLVEKFESLGIRCFNNSTTNKVANNKYLTYQFLEGLNIPCLKSNLSYDKLRYPFIMKSVDGHGGNEVFLINEKSDIDCYQLSSKKYIFQEFYENEGDVRLYVLNRKVIGAVLRKNKDDFRSNYSLGGKVSSVRPSKEIKDIAIKIADSLDADYIGVDFLKVNGQWLVNEIEDPVGARMLYKACGIDAVNLFSDYIFYTPKRKSRL